jgi:hypothetical protein
MSENDIEIEPCPVCGSCDCLDAQIAYWISKSTRAEAALAERDKRIAELEAVIMKISEITEREEQGPGWAAKIILDLDAAIKEAEKLVEAGR